MLIAQLTDLHLTAEGARAYGDRVDTNALAAAAVDRINALVPQPDLVIVTGDVTDHGTAQEYAVARGLLDRLRAPVAVMIGNHDEREAFREGLSGYAGVPADGFIQFVVETRPVRLVALDSTAAGAHHGEFCADRAAWLDARLAEARDVPTIVALHHPPFDTGIAWMDGEGAGWAAPLLPVLERHPQVVRVICGHLHRPIVCEVGGRIVTVAPSVAHQVALDLRPVTNFVDDLPEFEMEPAGFALHSWDGARLRTHVAHVGAWERFEPISREVLLALMEARRTGTAAPKTQF
jgi:Icc protein